MAYLVTKWTLEETLQFSEKIYQRAMKRSMEIITDKTELEAVQKYRDYQYSLVAHLKELQKRSA